MVYTLDSNTVSYLLRSEGNVRQHFEQEIAQIGNPYAIPFVVAYEVRRWLHDKPTRQIKILSLQFDALFQNVEDRAEMPSAVWEKAVEVYISLKQKGQLIGDVDILIEAYCLVNEYILVTRNTDDFKRIDSLLFVNCYG